MLFSERGVIKEDVCVASRCVSTVALSLCWSYRRSVLCVSWGRIVDFDHVLRLNVVVVQVVEGWKVLWLCCCCRLYDAACL